MKDSFCFFTVFHGDSISLWIGGFECIRGYLQNAAVCDGPDQFLDVFGGFVTEILPIAGTLIYGVYGFVVTKTISVAQFAVLISAVTSLKEIEWNY